MSPARRGSAGLERLTDTTVSDSNSPKSITVTCPAGKQVVGTGYDVIGALAGVGVNQTKEATVDQVS